MKTRAIVLADCKIGNSAPKFIQTPLSRNDIASWIEHQLKKSERTLIGIDCNFGYARAIGQQQFGEDYTYHDVWTAVEHESSGTPNYFAEGFWKSEKYSEYFWTSGTRPDAFDLKVQRATEKQCATDGLGHPESPFKLIGAKQVGKGGLAGMRFAYDLKRRFGDKICFLPFEAETSNTQIVITEIYPRLFIKKAGFGNTKIKNSTELNKALQFFDSKPLKSGILLNDHMTDAVIAAAGLRSLCGDQEKLPDRLTNPKGLTPEIARTEGWIFGVGTLD